MPQEVTALRDEGTYSQVVAAGAIAGLVSRFCIAPLDVIKIRLQLQYHSLSEPLLRSGSSPLTNRGALPTFLTILRHEGLRALWKGNLPAEAMYLTYGGLQFLSYGVATQTFDQLNLPAPATSFLAGATAGTVATVATYPLDLLRTRFAAQGTEKVYGSLMSGVRQIAAQEGAQGFFRGLGAGVGQIVPYMGLFFTLYEAFKPIFADLPLGGLGSGEAVAGVMASVLSKTAVFPLDTVRKRLQVQGPTRALYVHRNIPVYDHGVLHTLKAIVMREGIKGLYRGLPIGLFKAAPASAITIWTYERAMALLQKL